MKIVKIFDFQKSVIFKILTGTKSYAGIHFERKKMFSLNCSIKIVRDALISAKLTTKNIETLLKYDCVAIYG